MSRLGIVAVGYNRPDSLSRLLNRLNTCEYGNDSVLLIISLDNSGDSRPEALAASFSWQHGEKVIRTFPQRLGLKKHILTCGSYLEQYDLDAIAVFEDDIFPALGFYNFMKQAVRFYESDMNIAGISLYSHTWNFHCSQPFSPLKSDTYDVFFLQVAQSWGQIWMRKQWKDFEAWLLSHPSFAPSARVPETYTSWPESSWLKFHNQYIIETGRFFVYPYASLTTCFADAGEHAMLKANTFQVELEPAADRMYSFISLSSAPVLYDGYFEPLHLKRYLEAHGYHNTAVDFYGLKAGRERAAHVLGTREISGEVVASFGLDLRPWEQNVLNAIPGGEIKLVRLPESGVYQASDSHRTFMNRWLYLNRELPDWKQILEIVRYKLRYKFRLIQKGKKHKR